jgi:DnaJ-class molecular chaperone
MASSPVAVCTKCGKYSSSAQQINSQCNAKPDGKKRCGGVFGSALNENDWATCDLCNGKGRNESEICPCCQGFGVMYVR